MNELASSRSIILCILAISNIFSTAIIREIGINGDRVSELLSHAKDKVDPQFLSQALEVATRMDSDVNIGNIVSAGPLNVAECIKIAQREEKPHARAMLMLIRAAQTGNLKTLNQLHVKAYNPQRVTLSNDNVTDGHKHPLIYCALLDVNISPNVPIEIARQQGHSQVREELVMKTGVYPDKKHVLWSKLQLLELDHSLLRRISWVEMFKVDRNGLTTLSNKIAQYLKQVIIWITAEIL